MGKRVQSRIIILYNIFIKGIDIYIFFGYSFIEGEYNMEIKFKNINYSNELLFVFEFLFI